MHVNVPKTGLDHSYFCKVRNLICLLKNIFIMKKLQLIILLSFLGFATHAQVTANFTASDLNGCVPDYQIDFTNQSTSVEPIGTYSWDIDGVTFSTTENATYVFTNQGLYNICLTVTDNLGANDSHCELINIYDAPAVTLTSSPTPLSCNNTSVVLEANPFLPNTINTWIDPNGNVISNNTGTYVNNVGTYTFQTVDTLSGCSSVSSIEVVAENGYPEVVIQTPAVLSCTNTLITLDGTGSSNGPDYIYEWTVGHPNNVISTDLNTTVSSAGLYTL